MHSQQNTDILAFMAKYKQALSKKQNVLTLRCLYNSQHKKLVFKTL